KGRDSFIRGKEGIAETLTGVDRGDTYAVFINKPAKRKSIETDGETSQRHSLLLTENLTEIHPKRRIL
ncbi:hypothetical protein, partial [uncultured Parabacteroides sp.]|uniref:hypothetical protein n=1 Tax=uncultured Parabacteroides sp. TaxID=512312 RepID=UPI0025D2AF59